MDADERGWIWAYGNGITAAADGHGARPTEYTEDAETRRSNGEEVVDSLIEVGDAEAEYLLASILRLLAERIKYGANLYFDSCRSA